MRVDQPLIDVVLPNKPLPNPPKLWSVWQHRNGTFYVVLMVTNESDKQDEYPATVVYESMHTCARWSRKLSDWHKSMTFVRQWGKREIIDYLAGQIPL